MHSVLMAILVMSGLASVALAQDNDAEKLYRAMEKKLLEAKAVQFNVKGEIKTANLELDSSYKGTVLLGQDNKVRVKLSGDFGGAADAGAATAMLSVHKVSELALHFGAGCGVVSLPCRVGLPRAGKWREVLNSDAAIYAGSNKGNLGGMTAEKVPCHSQQQSAQFYLPPMSVIVFQNES